MCVCAFVGVCAQVHRCPWRPEEDTRSPGAWVKSVMSCATWMLGTQLKSSVREIHPLCCWDISPAPIQCISIGSTIAPFLLQLPFLWYTQATNFCIYMPPQLSYGYSGPGKGQRPYLCLSPQLSEVNQVMCFYHWTIKINYGPVSILEVLKKWWTSKTWHNMRIQSTRPVWITKWDPLSKQ